MDDHLTSKRARPPNYRSFGRLLLLAMDRGFGPSVEFRERGRSWLVKQLAAELNCSESTISDWRNDRRLPSPRYLNRLLDILFRDEKYGDERRNALLLAYNRSVSPTLKAEGDYIRSILPQQSPRVFLFELKTGKVAIAEDKPPPSQEFSSEQLEIYSDLCSDTQALIFACEPHSNRYNTLRDVLCSYRKALGATIQQLNRTKLWLSGRHLRRLQVADERRLSGTDVEDPPYDPAQGAA